MAVGLWIPTGSLVAALGAVAEMRLAIADPDLSADTDPESFFIADARPIGGELHDYPIHLYCTWESFQCNVEQEQYVEEVFGLRPEPGMFAIGTYIKGDDAERAVAVVAAHLAERTGGVVNFFCPLDLADELPGQTTLIRVGVCSPQGQTAMDAVAMRAWSRHPRCWVLR